MQIPNRKWQLDNDDKVLAVSLNLTKTFDKGLFYKRKRIIV